MDRSGRLIAAGQNNGAAHVWNLATGREVVVRHRASILDDIALSPNSHVLATAGQDSTARLWDARSGRPLATLRHRDIIVNTVAFSSDGRLVVSSGSDGTARVWRVPGGDPVATLRHGGWVEDARFSPDGRRIVTAARDARLWRVDGRLEHILRGHVGGVSRASFSPDGSVVATAGHDGTARLWDAPTGQSRALLAGHSDSIRRVEFHPAGNGLLTASDDGTARLWSVPGAEPLGVLRGHVGDITDAHFSPDGRQVVTASRDHSARLWRTAATEQPLATLGREPGAVVVSPDARWLVATFYSGAVRVWHVDDWDRGEHLTTGASWGEAAFSPDSELLATSGRSRGVRLWRAPDWRPAGVLPTVEQVEGVAFRRDGRVIATVAGGTAQLWDAETRRPLPGASVQLQDTDEYAAATYPSFSRDGRLVLFSGGAAQVWDPRRPTTTLLEVDGHVANPSSMSANGDVVIGEQDGRTATWRIRGARLDPLAQRAGEGAALNPAGSVAITGGEGRATEMWASDGGRRIRTLPTPDGAAWAGFSPTGRFVATAAFTGGARLWDTATGTEIVAFAASESLDTITRATIGPDDTRIFVAADRLRVHRCDACAPFPKVLELARSRAEVLR